MFPRAPPTKSPSKNWTTNKAKTGCFLRPQHHLGATSAVLTIPSTNTMDLPGQITTEFSTAGATHLRSHPCSVWCRMSIKWGSPRRIISIYLSEMGKKVVICNLRKREGLWDPCLRWNRIWQKCVGRKMRHDFLDFWTENAVFYKNYLV